MLSRSPQEFISCRYKKGTVFGVGSGAVFGRRRYLVSVARQNPVESTWTFFLSLPFELNEEALFPVLLEATADSVVVGLRLPNRPVSAKNAPTLLFRLPAAPEELDRQLSELLPAASVGSKSYAVFQRGQEEAAAFRWVSVRVARKEGEPHGVAYQFSLHSLSSKGGASLEWTRTVEGADARGLDYPDPDSVRMWGDWGYWADPVERSAILDGDLVVLVGKDYVGHVWSALDGSSLHRVSLKSSMTKALQPNLGVCRTHPKILKLPPARGSKSSSSFLVSLRQGVPNVVLEDCSRKAVPTARALNGTRLDVSYLSGHPSEGVFRCGGTRILACRSRDQSIMVLVDVDADRVLLALPLTEVAGITELTQLREGIFLVRREDYFQVLDARAALRDPARPVPRAWVGFHTCPWLGLRSSGNAVVLAGGRTVVLYEGMSVPHYFSPTEMGPSLVAPEDPWETHWAQENSGH